MYITLKETLKWKKIIYKNMSILQSPRTINNWLINDGTLWVSYEFAQLIKITLETMKTEYRLIIDYHWFNIGTVWKYLKYLVLNFMSQISGINTQKVSVDNLSVI